MKKIVAFILTVSCIFTFVPTAFAATRIQFTTTTPAENDGVKIDAYQRIYVDQLDGQNGMKLSTMVSPDDGTTVPIATNTGKYSYMYFYNVDFGNVSPKGIRMGVYNTGGDMCMIQTQVILDDPKGYPIATSNIFLDEPEYYWGTTTAPITTNVTGVHDVYLAFNRQEFAISWIEFTKETPEKNQMEKIMDDYLATPAIEATNMYSDTWVATDVIGRKLSDNTSVGDTKDNKQIAMFYHTWRSGWSRNNIYYPYDTTKILNHYDGDPADIKNDVNYPYWCPITDFQFWNESIYGYYGGYDRWVARKNLELLGAIGVDTLVLDGTNNCWTFISGYMDLAKEAHKMNATGYKAPKITFMGRFTSVQETADQIREFYENVYSTGLYADTWFYFDGKPLYIANTEILSTETGYDDIDAQNKEMLNFFTLRSPVGTFRIGQTEDDQWSWNDVFPQFPYNQNSDGSYEMISVSAAQNLSDDNTDGLSSAMNGDGIYGRSYTYKDKHSKLTETSYIYGYNYQEQWERALTINPELIFLSGWNESYANRFSEHLGVKNAMTDTFNTEYSRDLEPIKSEHKDTYYLLTAEYIRQFKGVQKTPTAGAKTTISVDGDFSQWNSVTPTFYDYTGIPDRNSIAFGRTKVHTNYTGRNDFKYSKVARDDQNLYFYVETVDNITPYSDNAWMRLFLNTDRLYSTGWEGYDYALNIEPASPSTLVLSRSTGFWDWEKVADVEYKVTGNKMMVKIPRNLVGLSGTTNLDFEFKWADNMQTQGNLMEDFYTNGDSAPIARFNYRFVEDTSESNVTNENLEFTFNPFDKIRHFAVLKENTEYALTDEGAVPLDESHPEAKTIVIDETVFVPVNFFKERLDAQKIEWDTSKSVVISYAQVSVRISSGSKKIVSSLKGNITSDEAPFIQNGIMYAPVDAVAEAFGNVWVEHDDKGYTFVGDKYTDDYYNDPAVRSLMNKYFQQEDECTIKFIIGEHGTTTDATELTLNYGDTVTVPEVIPNEGYIFTGWDKEIAETANGNATYTANFELGSYTITFDLNGKGTTDNATVIAANYGDNITPPVVTADSGYLFLGWSPEITTVTKDATYTALYGNINDSYLGVLWTKNLDGSYTPSGDFSINAPGVIKTGVVKITFKVSMKNNLSSVSFIARNTTASILGNGLSQAMQFRSGTVNTVYTPHSNYNGDTVKENHWGNNVDFTKFGISSYTEPHEYVMYLDFGDGTAGQSISRLYVDGSLIDYGYNKIGTDGMSSDTHFNYNGFIVSGASNVNFYDLKVEYPKNELRSDNITIEKGVISGGNSSVLMYTGSAEAGDNVRVAANTGSGYIFKGWYINNDTNPVSTNSISDIKITADYGNTVTITPKFIKSGYANAGIADFTVNSPDNYTFNNSIGWNKNSDGSYTPTSDIEWMAYSPIKSGKVRVVMDYALTDTTTTPTLLLTNNSVNTINNWITQYFQIRSDGNERFANSNGLGWAGADLSLNTRFKKDIHNTDRHTIEFYLDLDDDTVQQFIIDGKVYYNGYNTMVTAGQSTSTYHNIKSLMVVGAANMKFYRLGIEELSDSDLPEEVTVTLNSNTKSPSANGFTVPNGTVYAYAGTAHVGDVIAVSAIPKSGYMFAGWYDGTKLLSTDTIADITVTGNMNIVPKFVTETYTIKFNVGTKGSTNDKTEFSATYGDTITPPSITAKSGYLFKGWDKDVSEYANGNATYTAVYEAIKYTITFDIGSNGTTNDETVISVNHGDKITPPQVTAKSGYLFLGWNSAIQPATKNVTYTALYGDANDSYLGATWTKNDDGSYTPSGDIVWDNGTPVTTGVVKITFKMALKNNSMNVPFIAYNNGANNVGDGLTQAMQFRSGTINTVYTPHSNYNGDTVKENHWGNTVDFTNYGITSYTEPHEYVMYLDFGNGTAGQSISRLYVDGSLIDYGYNKIGTDGMSSDTHFNYKGFKVKEASNVNFYDLKVEFMDEATRSDNISVAKGSFSAGSSTVNMYTGSAEHGDYIRAVATVDTASGYSFRGWYINGSETPISTKAVADIKVDSDYGNTMTITPKFNFSKKADGGIVDFSVTPPSNFTFEDNISWTSKGDGSYTPSGNVKWLLNEPVTSGKVRILWDFKLTADDKDFLFLVSNPYVSTAKAGSLQYINIKKGTYIFSYELTAPKTQFSHSNRKADNKELSSSDGTLLFNEGKTKGIYDKSLHDKQRHTIEFYFDLDGDTVQKIIIDGKVYYTGYNIMPTAGLNENYHKITGLIANNVGSKIQIYKMGLERLADGDLPEEVTIKVSGQKEDNSSTTRNGFTVPGGTAYVYAGQAHVGDVLAAVAVPNSGYQFLGWYNDDKLISKNTTADITVTGNMNIVPKFAKNPYTVTFVVGENGTTDDETVILAGYGDIIKVPEITPKDNYIFLGWDKNVSTTVTETVTYTAQYKLNLKNVKFNIGENGTTTDTTEFNVVPGTTITVPQITAKEGWIFKGWDKEIALNVTEDATYTAQYEKKSYTVNFTASEGGSLNGETSVLFYHGDTLIVPEVTADTGYEFAGWEPEIPATVTSDGTYTAKFNKSKYTVTFTINGEAYKTDEYSYGDAIVVPDYDIPEGYIFSGWTVDDTMPAENKTYNATLTIKKFTVKFVNYDGTVLSSHEVEFGTVPEYKGLTPERESTPQSTYIFSGWDSEITAAKADATYTATYTENVNIYVVTWIVDGVKTEEYYEYGKTPEFSVPEKEGYVFVGWDKEVVSVAENVTYTALYELAKYTVTFDLDGKGTTSDKTVIKVNHGDTVIPPQVTANSGYLFLGWDKDICPVTTDVTYTALYGDINDSYLGATWTKNNDGSYTPSGDIIWDNGTPVTTGVVKITFKMALKNNSVNVPFIAYNNAQNKVGNGLTQAMQFRSGTINTVYTPHSNYNGGTVKENHWGNTVDFTKFGISSYTEPHEYVMYLDFGNGTAGQSISRLYVDGALIDYGYNKIGTDGMSSDTHFNYKGFKVISASNVNFYDLKVEFMDEATRSDNISVAKGSFSAGSSTVNMYTGSAEVGDFVRAVANPDKSTGYSFKGWKINNISTLVSTDPVADIEVKSEYGSAMTITPVFIYGKKADGGIADFSVTSPSDYEFDWATTWTDNKDGSYTPNNNVYWSLNKPITSGKVRILWDYQLTTSDKDFLFLVANPHAGGSVKNDGTLQYLQITNSGNYAGNSLFSHSNRLADNQSFSFTNASMLFNIGDNKGVYDISLHDKQRHTIEFYFDLDGDTVQKVIIDGKVCYTGYNIMPTAGLNETYHKITAIFASNVLNRIKIYRLGVENITDYPLPDEVTITVAGQSEDNSATTRNGFGVKGGIAYAYAGKARIGDVLAAVAVPLENYKFVGWYDGDKLISKKASCDITVTGNMDITPKFILNPYTITFVVGENGTTEDETDILVAPGEIIPVPEITAKEGYIFTGWDKSVDTTANGDATYIAQYKPVQHTVKFIIGENGTTSDNTEHTVNYGTVITAPTVTAKEGWTFKGWDKEFASKVTADAIYTAQYVKNVYTVNFIADEGGYINGESSIIFSHGDTIIAPEAIANPGYEFAGWEPEVPLTATKAATYKAKFNRVEYTLTFIAEGKTIKTVKGYLGDVISAPEIPAKTGYSAAWDKEIPSVITGNDTFTAQYTINRYTVTFTVNGETYETAEFEYGSKIVVPRYDIPEGYSFSGWTVDETMAAENKTYDATLSINRFTVEFVDEDGTVLQSEEYDYGSVPAFKGETPVKESTDMYSYTFDGWTPEIVAVTENTTYTAKFSETAIVYTVTFMADGNVVDTVTGNFGDTLVAPEIPVKEHFTAAWDSVPTATIEGNATYTAEYTAINYTVVFVIGSERIERVGTFGTALEVPEIPEVAHKTASWNVTPTSTIEGNATYTAVYTDVIYTVTFVVDGKTTEVKGVYGADLTAPEIPAKTGYSAAWNKEIPSVITGNDTFTAQYTINKYTITFVDEDGTVLQSEEYDYGSVPTFKGETPVKEATAKYSYTFAGWDSVISEATESVTYTATYNITVNKYIITWIVDDISTEVEYEYGDIPEFEVPTKEGYIFTGWDKDVVNVTDNATYTAQFAKAKYTVTFIVGEKGTTSDETIFEDVEYGETITVPEVTANDEYEFTGWNPVIEGDTITVTGNATYTALYRDVILFGDITAYNDADATIEYNSLTKTITVKADKETNELGAALVPSANDIKVRYTMETEGGRIWHARPANYVSYNGEAEGEVLQYVVRREYGLEQTVTAVISKGDFSETYTINYVFDKSKFEGFDSNGIVGIRAKEDTFRVEVAEDGTVNVYIESTKTSAGFQFEIDEAAEGVYAGTYEGTTNLYFNVNKKTTGGRLVQVVSKKAVAEEQTFTVNLTQKPKGAAKLTINVTVKFI